MARLVKGIPLIANAWRTLMPRFEVYPALTADAFRTPPAKVDLVHVAAVADPYDGGFRVTLTYPAYNILDAILPEKIHICAFKPGAVVPGTGSEVFALAGSAIGTTAFPGHDPIQGDEGPEQTVLVGVNVTSLFDKREATLPGVILVPVAQFAE